MRAPVATAVAIGVGLVILLGYFLPIPALQEVKNVLINWAVSLTGVAVLVGVLNLVLSHLRKMRSQTHRDPYSFLLVFAFLGTVGAGLVLGPMDPQFQQVVLSIQVPVEASLMAVLAVALAYTSVRLLQNRRDAMSILFVLSTAVFLIVSSGVLAGGAGIPYMDVILTVLNRLPIAGARGILLGLALGSLTTGLRILLAADRPYSG